ncbi:hypothetical protein JCM10908_005115 [Rhodotorula pacifica]|uniref:uncharacterized protein n=1 Tax=Rhodotorula pacifica TaxID=1495444 RepID=UPI0031774499
MSATVRIPTSVPYLGRQGNVRNCDACRRKKTKCDRLPRCSNCAMRGIDCTYDDAGDTAVGSLMENQVLILRLRQNVFALARHLDLSPMQLQELAGKADEKALAALDDGAATMKSQKRRSLHEILLGVAQDQAAARAHPRIAETPAAYAQLKQRALSQSTDATKADRAPSNGVFPTWSRLVSSSKPSSGPPKPHAHRRARRFSDPPPRQQPILPSFHIPTASREPSRTPGAQLPPIAISAPDFSPPSGRTASSLPTSFRSAVTPSTATSLAPSPRLPFGGPQLPPLQQEEMSARFQAFRLPPPRPTQREYCGIGPSLAAFATSPGSSR